MPQPHIGEPITLRDYISQCIEDENAGGWMTHKSDHYSLDMQLLPVTLDEWPDDPEEYEAIEAAVLVDGYGNCLNAEQIVDVVEVLKSQKPDYSDEDLERSLNYYSERDTFLTL